MGELKMSVKFSSATQYATINIASLPADAYMVKIFNGLSWEEHKILVVK
jgi:hypothetical protein